MQIFGVWTLLCLSRLAAPGSIIQNTCKLVTLIGVTVNRAEVPPARLKCEKCKTVFVY